MELFDVYSVFPVNIVRGKGCEVYDEKGQAYLDLYGGHAVISVGHSHPYLVKCMSEQLQQLMFYSNSVVNKLQERLANELGELSGYPDYRAFFVNSGAEANENALKLASFHTGKKRVVAFRNSFHGRTSAAVDIALTICSITENTMNAAFDLALYLVTKFCFIKAFILIHWCYNRWNNSLDLIVSAHFSFPPSRLLHLPYESHNPLHLQD